jgi:hypothetical protein
MGPLPPRNSLFPVPLTSTETRNTLLGAASSVSDRWPQYPYANALALLGGTPSATPSLFGGASAGVSNWLYVRARFIAFLSNLAITPAQHEDGTTKQAGVRACLNRHYWGNAL